MNQFRVTICSLCLVLALTDSYAQAPERPHAPEMDVIIEPFDRFGDNSWEDEKARLDNFAAALLTDRDLIGYILVYAGKPYCTGDAQRRGVRAKTYLVEYRGVDWNRVIWKDAGYLAQPFVTLWYQVRGSEPYPFWRPQSLADVKTKDCRAKSNMRKRRSGK